MDIHIFVRSLKGIFALAIIGVGIATVVTAVFLKYVASDFANSCIDYSPLKEWDTALMMGSILSATDPVAVVQLLKSLGASPSLGTLIEGESLLNDGTAYVMFLIFQQRSHYTELRKYMPSMTCGSGAADLAATTMIATNTTLDLYSGGTLACSEGQVENVEGGDILTLAARLVIVGPLLGYLVGAIAVNIVEFVYNDVLIETTMTVLAAYTSWCLAEYFHSSGVLAVVVTGLWMSHGRGLAFTEKAKHFLHEFWEMLGYLLNTMIFIISGTVIGRKWADDSNAVSRKDLPMVIIIYLWIHVARAISLFVSQPFVNKHVCTCGRRFEDGGGRCTSYDFNWRQSVVMWWGGLRGAVGLALGLIVSENPFWRNDAYKSIPNETKSFYRDAAIFNIGLVALLTLTINGVTMGPLVRMLGLSKQSSEIAEKNLQRVIDELDLRLRKKIHHLNKDGSEARIKSRVHQMMRQKGNQSLVGQMHFPTSPKTSAAPRTMAVTKKPTFHEPHRKVKTAGEGKRRTLHMNKAKSLQRQQEGGHNDKDGHKKQHHHHHHHSEHIHVNHHEFENVDWDIVYQYMPVESRSVYERRVQAGEVQSWWGG